MKKKLFLVGLLTGLLVLGMLLSSCGVKCYGSCGRNSSDCRQSCRESDAWCCNPAGD